MNFDVLIIGGGPAGIITALTAKSVNPDKSIVLVKEIGDGVIPCAIPYMIHSMDSPQQNAMGNAPLENAGVDIIVGKAIRIDTAASKVELSSGESIGYERLVLATGTTATLPPIPGVDKQGVYMVQKSLSEMTILREKYLNAKHAVIIGGGFIGTEFGDELSRLSQLKVHLVEMLPTVLYSAFDDEFCTKVATILEKSGVTLHTNCKVRSIDGDKRVESVTLEDGSLIAAGVVLVAVGGQPASQLARDAGLLVADNGSIWVDEYMRTEVENIFAVGDCALKRDFFTRKAAPVWLASTATAEARNAGTNL